MLAAPLLYPKLASLHTEKHLTGKCVYENHGGEAQGRNRHIVWIFPVNSLKLPFIILKMIQSAPTWLFALNT